ncbi:MAG TPA: 2-dehydropantoate 2-reductase, partial [Stellaceae bacterium]|nr:2-dehydropantoate 2-reductase [Stellaceae bacterium]
RLEWEDGTRHFGKLYATDKLAELGKQDHVILALKAHQLCEILADIDHLLDAHTTLVTMQNGIPFWYFHRHGGEYEGRVIESVDPGGAIVAKLGIERIIGSVVYPASVLAEPGFIHHVESNRFTFGEPDGSSSERLGGLAAAMRDAGFKCPVIPDIRNEIWLKLWGNLTFNPISALSHATLEELCTYPPTRDLAVQMMTEAQNVAERLGVAFRVGIERRIAGAQAVGAHKTSMLQDVEAGRALELDALVGSVVEIGRLVGVPTPHIDAVYACTKLLDRTLRRQKGMLAVR